MMRMCRCAGRVRFRGRLRAGVAVAASAVSRQEIETCLVKRARRSIHASFWLFHQPARNASISDAAARGDGVSAAALPPCSAVKQGVTRAAIKSIVCSNDAQFRGANADSW